MGLEGIHRLRNWAAAVDSAPPGVVTSSCYEAHKPGQPIFELRPLQRNRELIAYVLDFVGNTWEVFSIGIWLVVCVSWTLNVLGDALSLPAVALTPNQQLAE